MIPAYRPSSVRLVRDPRTGRWAYVRPTPQALIGQTEPAPLAKTPPEQPEESFTVSDLSKAFTHAITPTLIVVGIATGAAFAIGSGLVSRYLFKDRGR